MTRYFNFKVLTTCLLIFISIPSFSQEMELELEPYKNPDYGPDSLSRIECAYDLSNLASFMEINLPDYALPAWRRLFKNCPASRKNIYISGAKIFQYLIEKELDETKKQAYFDTLMLIYDRRIEFFGDEGYVLGRKGMDIIRYKPEAFPDAYAAFSRSAVLSGMETDLNVVTGLVQTAAAVYQQDQIGTVEFLDKYFFAEKIFNSMIEAKKSIPRVKRAQAVNEKIIKNSGIRDCEGIETFFRKEFESNAQGNTIQLAIDLMTTAGCDNTYFFAEANEMLMKIDPDPSVAYEVAKYNLQNSNFKKAAEYLSLAIEHEENKDQKAQYLHQLAVIYLSKLSDPDNSKKYAELAVENKPDWGEPYFIIAAAIIEKVRSCSAENFEKQAVYWLAVDYCLKAKTLDPSSEAKANDLIRQYQAGYPNVEETFFRSLKEGDSYQIGCGINEITRVKSK